MEAALSEIEVWYRTLVETSSSAIMLYDDKKLRFIDANPKASELFGLSKPDLLQSNFMNLSPEIQADGISTLEKYQGIVKLMSNQEIGVPLIREWLHQKPDGTQFLCQLKLCILPVNGKRIIRVIVHDISDQRKVEEKLKVKNDLYRTLFETADDAIFTLQEGRITEFNHKTLEMFGCSSEQLLNQTPQHFSPERQFNGELSEDEAKRHIHNAYLYGPQTFEWAHCKFDGTPVAAEVSLNVTRINNEDYLQAIVRDISERKRTESELERHRENLENLVENRTSEVKKLSKAIEQSPVAVLITDPEGLIEYVNPRFTEMFVYSLDEVKGKNPSILRSYNSTAISEDELWKIMSTGEKWHGDFLNQTKDGKEIWVSATISSIRNKDGSISNFVSVQEDITERKQREGELNQARMCAEKANHAKSLFLANISHEIRTPMNAILGFSEVLDENLKDPQLKKYLSHIQASGRTLLTLINDILDLSKVEAGKLELQLSGVYLRELFGEIQQVFAHKFLEKGLNLQISVGSGVPNRLLMDENRLRQILMNLVNNALKFTDEGGVTLSASLNTGHEIDTPKLIISVQDTGKGIPSDQYEQVFDAFEQVKGQDSMKYGGTGLGLAITRRLVELMNGEICVESKINEGSCFNISFNNVKLMDDIPTKPQSTGSPLPKVKFCNSKILVVDDVKLNRKLIKSFLKDYKELELLNAKNGIEAIEVARRKHPDLILLDLKMPVMDGYEAARIMKNDPELKSIPIVTVTASAMKKDLTKAVCNYDSYLTKPTRKAELIEELMKYLPHSISEYTQDENEKSNNKKRLSCEYLNEFPELTVEVGYLLPHLADAGEMNEMDALEELATQILTMATDHHCELLQNWADALLFNVTNFELDLIKIEINNLTHLLSNKG